MVAYHCGKAANVAPPAVISHTSLPAQHRQQDPDPEVESLQHEVPGPQGRDEDEPEGREVHDSSLTCLRVQYEKTGRGSSVLVPVSVPSGSTGAPAWTCRIVSHPAMAARPAYSRVNTVSEMITEETVTPAETLCAVVSRPNTVQGWRPISVKIQPIVVAR